MGPVLLKENHFVTWKEQIHLSGLLIFQEAWEICLYTLGNLPLHLEKSPLVVWTVGKPVQISLALKEFPCF